MRLGDYIRERGETDARIIELRDKILEVQNELEEARDGMTAKDNIPQGGCFVLHDAVYRATDPITKGSEIKPGYNCEKTTLDECINREGV